MAKMPFFQFYPSDWLRDTRSLTAKTKGVWIDILAIAWNEPQRGIYSRRRHVMARELGLTRKELADALLELCETKIADQPQLGNGNVTVVSRRMVKEETIREKDRIRQQQYRCHDAVTEKSEVSHAPVTPNKSEVRSQKLEVINDPLPKGAFNLIWARYPKRKGRKAASRSFLASVKSMQDWLDIQNALDHYIAEIRRDRIDPQFVKHGSTWFNNWRDDVDYRGVELPKPPVPKPKPVEPPPPENTHEENLEMHRLTVTVLKRCPAGASCELCKELNVNGTTTEKLRPDADRTGTAPAGSSGAA